MKDFLFRPEQARTPVGTLSGGERARLILARAFAQASNILVLDEPTNDLDLETLDLLQERLAEYPGTVLLVSHDRDFLDRVVTSVVASEGKGRWIEYAGGYSDMLTQRPASAAAVPAAIGGSSRPTARPTPAVASRPRRLSFSEQRALETLPARIEALQARVAVLNNELAHPGLYARDPDGFAAMTAALAAVHQELSAAEDQWLALEIRSEEIESARTSGKAHFADNTPRG